MNILSLEDQPDGSAILEIEMTAEEQNMLIKYAILDIVKKHCKNNYKEEVKRKCFKCGCLISEKILKEYPDTEICSECIDSEIKKG